MRGRNLRGACGEKHRVSFKEIFLTILLNTFPVAVVLTFGYSKLRDFLSESGFGIPRSIYSIVLVLVLMGLLQLTAGGMLSRLFRSRQCERRGDEEEG